MAPVATDADAVRFLDGSCLHSDHSVVPAGGNSSGQHLGVGPGPSPGPITWSPQRTSAALHHRRQLGEVEEWEETRRFVGQQSPLWPAAAPSGAGADTATAVGVAATADPPRVADFMRKGGCEGEGSGGGGGLTTVGDSHLASSSCCRRTSSNCWEDVLAGLLPCGWEFPWSWRSSARQVSECPLVVTPHSDQQQQRQQRGAEVREELKPQSLEPESNHDTLRVDVSWGPTAVHRVRKEFPLVWEGPPTRVTVTCPEQLSNEAFPVVVMFNGLLCEAKWYRGLVDRVVSWGYAVVQYDMEVLVDSAEVAILDPLLQLLSLRMRQGELPPGLDMRRLAVLGHGRGAKLAALHLEKDDLISTAVLLDPVDMTSSSTSPLMPYSSYMSLDGGNSGNDNDSSEGAIIGAGSSNDLGLGGEGGGGGGVAGGGGVKGGDRDREDEDEEIRVWREVVSELRRALLKAEPGAVAVAGDEVHGSGAGTEEVARWLVRLEGVASRLPEVCRSLRVPGPLGNVRPSLDRDGDRDPDLDRSRGPALAAEVHHGQQQQQQQLQRNGDASMRRREKVVGILGAAVGSLIPPWSKYHRFWSGAAPGSRLLVLPQAGHMQFLDLDCESRVPHLLNEVLGRGDGQDTVEAAAVFTAACLHEAFQEHQGPVSAFEWRLGHYQYMMTMKREGAAATAAAVAAAALPSRVDVTASSSSGPAV